MKYNLNSFDSITLKLSMISLLKKILGFRKLPLQRIFYTVCIGIHVLESKHLQSYNLRRVLREKEGGRGKNFQMGT